MRSQVERLAKTEDRQVQGEFGRAYADFARDVPAFIPHLGARSGEELSRPE
jgi:protein-S-isoprenylcysteine O-methyltransferase Ste14